MDQNTTPNSTTNTIINITNNSNNNIISQNTNPTAFNTNVEAANKENQNQEIRKIKIFRNDAGGFGFTLSRINHSQEQVIKRFLKRLQLYRKLTIFFVNSRHK